MSITYAIWSEAARHQRCWATTSPETSTFTATPSRRRTISERCVTDTHGQIGMLLTLSAVPLRRHSYHSQADSERLAPRRPERPRLGTQTAWAGIRLSEVVLDRGKAPLPDSEFEHPTRGRAYSRLCNGKRLEPRVCNLR